MKDFKQMGASWIWIDCEPPGENEYIEFRQEFGFNRNRAIKAKLRISADSNYAVWLNGIFVNCGQYGDFPDQKVYDTLEIGHLLREGRNVLCILAYYQGKTCHTYLKGEPGLVYALGTGENMISSGENTYCRRSKAYASGPIYEFTPQLSFAFGYDAAKGDNWTAEKFKMEGEWKRAQIRNNRVFGEAIRLKERPVRKLELRERVGGAITAQGVFLRRGGNGKNVAQLMQSDYLSSRTIHEVFCLGADGKLPSENGLKLDTRLCGDNDGIYLLIDLGREEAGFLQIEADTNEGTMIDIAFGEQVDDLRVRAVAHSRNYAVRYLCREGRQKFTHYFKRLGCRYLQLHVFIPETGLFNLYYAGIVPTEYPLEHKGAFHCMDSLYNRIYEVSLRTLELCMHEHYEDTPYREQALYSMDSRNQALCGYYCFGEYDFAGASIDLLGHGIRNDGFLHLVAPSENKKTIPCFSMLWIIEVWEYYMFSGRLEDALKHLPVVDRIIEACMRYVSKGLMAAPTGIGYWHFYEWSDGLDGCDDSFGFPVLETGRLDAPLNLFFLMALDSASKLAAAAGDFLKSEEYKKYSLALRSNFYDAFWDEQRQAYRNYAGDGQEINQYSELTQALALCSGVCTEDVAANLRQKLSSDANGLKKITLSHSVFKFTALLEEPEKYASYVFDSLAADWGGMLFKGATSFWETIEGASAFDNAGSMCHGWSAVPVYFYQAYLLGVKPLEPGFRSFELKPVMTRLGSASGKVPTPYGDIAVSWTKCDGKVDLKATYPEAINKSEEELK